jgi:hypothetical protein
MKYRLQCNFCTESFVHIGDSFPDSCPLCGAYVGLNGKPEVTLPFVSSAANKSPDKLNRAMEEGSKHRAYMAAEMTGQPVSDFSGLLHTDMKDNLREGDTSYKPVQLKDGMTASFGNSGQQRPEVAQAIASVQSERDPRARGVGQMSSVSEFHRKHAASIVRSGQEGKH